VITPPTGGGAKRTPCGAGKRKTPCKGLTIGEVWAGELAMIAAGGKVIRPGSGTLVIKIAQRDCPAIGPYSGVPPASGLVPGDTPEFGARARTGGGVAGIL